MSKKKKMDIVTKMSIIGVLGLVMVLVMILAIACSGNKSKKNNTSKPGTETTIEDNKEDNNRDIEYERALAVIKKVDTKNKKLIILNIEDNEVSSLNMDSAVDLRDEYNSLLTLVQLNVGDLIETKYDKEKMRPEFVHKTAKTWERKNVSGINVDKENKMITIGNDKYSYTEELVTIYNGNSFEVSDISSADQVTIKGYKDKLWVIILESGHGFITLKNHSAFIGGLLEIGAGRMVDIEEVTTVVVPVGVHDIVVTKDNLTYETEVMVAMDQDVIVDVKDASPRTGMVEFTAVQEGIAFSINGETYNDFSEPISLEYGTYKIKVVKENYVDWEKELVVNRPFVKFEINLEKRPTFIHVDSPQGVDIYIDGSYIGAIPITTPIDPGNHTITLRKDGYYSKMHPVVIEDTGADSYLTFPSLEKINDNPSSNTGNNGNSGNESNNGNGTINNPVNNNTTDNNTNNTSNTNEYDNNGTSPSSDVYNN